MRGLLETRCLTLLIAAILGANALAYDLSGIVVAPDEQPIAGARVWLSQDRIPRVTTSDENGAFAFAEVAAGTIDIVALVDGYGLGGVHGQLIDNANVAIELTRPETIRLRMIDAGYEPVSGARLRRLALNGEVQVVVEDLVALGFPSIRSDDDGFLTIPSLPMDAYVSVTVSHRDYADASLPALPVPMELDLPMPDAIPLRGRVTNEAGEGVARARLSVFRTIDEQEYEVAEVLTDSEGFYQANAQPHHYSVAARHPDYAMPKPMPVTLSRDDAEAIVNLVLPKAHRIIGATLDTNGDAVPMVKLSYAADNIIYDEAVSDVAGAFELTVASGWGVLKVTPPPRMMTVNYPRIGFQVIDEPEVRLDPIELQPLPEIHGQVAAAAGVALDRVLITSLDLDPPVLTTTDKDGRFVIELDEMYEEPIAFRAEHALRFLRGEFTVDPRSEKTPEVQLAPFQPDLEQSEEPDSNDLDHMLGKPAPEIACDAWFNLPTGETELSLAALRGKVVVLTLWGGFDTLGRTRHRIDHLNALHALLADSDDVVFLGVHDASVEPPEVARYAAEFGIDFPIGCDADPFLTFDRYNTNIIPQTVLIDKEGVLRYYKVNDRIPELIKDLRRR